jgi:tetratricopeptide (TPR) repeat protein
MAYNSQTEKRTIAIRHNFETRDTDELLGIWQQNDREEWPDEAFDTIEKILIERLGKIPLQDLHLQAVDMLGEPELVSLARQNLQKAARYIEQGKLDKAFEACEVAIQNAPNFAAAYNYLGMVYNALGQLEDAIAAYREAIRLDPEFIEAKDNLRAAENEFEETGGSASMIG